MEVKNNVVPNEQQIAGFFEPGPDGSIYMVNLLKFKDRAEYEDGPRQISVVNRPMHSTALESPSYSQRSVAAPCSVHRSND